VSRSSSRRRTLAPNSRSPIDRRGRSSRYSL
jgi:hypothetical protein